MTNISRNKDNQAIKPGQLLEYNLRNIFLEKSCRSLSKKSKLSTFQDSKVLYILSLLYAKLRAIERD